MRSEEIRGTEIVGTLDRKTLNKWKKTNKSFIYKPKGRTFYYVDGKRFRLSGLLPKQIKKFGIEKKKYESAVYISKIVKLKYKERKLEKKIRKKKIKKEPEERKQMYRVTLGINYSVHYKYYSVKTQMWSVTWLKLKDNEQKLKDEIINRLKRKLNWKKNWENWFDFEPNVCYDDVDYNPKLEGKIEETDEFLKLETKRRQSERLIKAQGQDVPDWN